MTRTLALLACAPLALAAACSVHDATPANAQAALDADAAAPAAAPTAAASPAATPAAGGFDPASAPVANPTLGAFPFFGLLDGYVPLNADNSPSSFDRENQKDVGYDRYEFFDGTKLIPVEGRLRTVEAIGTGGGYYMAAKNYEKLIHDMGGVTVWEGSGQVMLDKHLDFAERRHRNRYGSMGAEKMAVYMVRTPDRELWVEVYARNDDKPDNYWLTVVEKKSVDVTAKLLPAEAMKKALDANGHVALDVHFDTDKTAVKADSQPLLAEVVKLLTNDPSLKLTIEGHTDDAGTPAHNQALSVGRANAVMGTLIAGGIDPARLQAKGFGQTRPVADNSTDDGKAKNRRVELVKR